jgi:ABC-type transport system involved in cytochrome bd biosynthesis fused ATPase/permease subunit
VKLLVKLFPAGHLVISLMFLLCAASLIVFSMHELWVMVLPGGEESFDQRLTHVLNSVALLTVAVAALELSQTILEEEVQREAHMSAPTRVRRFLSRFMIVLVVSLTIEALVNVFKYSRDDPSNLPYAASIGLMAAALLAAWGVFIRLNQGAEELEPEAMADAKREDHKVEGAKRRR